MQYCSSKCQKEDWEQHKDFCKEKRKKRKQRREKRGKNEEERCRGKMEALTFSEVDWVLSWFIAGKFWHFCRFATLFRMKLHIYDPCWIGTERWTELLRSNSFCLCATFSVFLLLFVQFKPIGYKDVKVWMIKNFHWHLNVWKPAQIQQN